MPKVETKPNSGKKARPQAGGKAKAADKPSPRGPVRVRNLMQRRPVLLHFPGGAHVRLGPGETMEISEVHARSREFLRFCRDGLLHVEASSGSAPAAEKAVAPVDAPAAGKVAGSAENEASKAKAAESTKPDDPPAQPDSYRRADKEE
jgi:hypothetical protein